MLQDLAVDLHAQSCPSRTRLSVLPVEYPRERRAREESEPKEQCTSGDSPFGPSITTWFIPGLVFCEEAGPLTWEVALSTGHRNEAFHFKKDKTKIKNAYIHICN